ncbi:hypothetical protein [Orenia marismortui]|uniref:Spore coat protein CotO n=1 Tax=Orenia marismortui TaxID=46469 RepID=A0A4R8GY36_9FIRM|nr:hypothetical protein [Orenia marismortui]TDX51280.1 hypothetical protein C7959_11428 [Orenia marismortui]
MELDLKEAEELEGLLEEIMMDLINNKSKSSSNSLIPSLNSFSRDNKVRITEKEVIDLLNTLNELTNSSNSKNSLGTNRRKFRREKEKVSKKEVENIKSELKEFISNELADLENGEVETKNINISKKSRFFKEELDIHWKNFDYIDVIIVSGSECCEISGILCGVYNDFIIIVDEGDKIKIPIDKISAIKLSSDNNKRKKKDDQKGIDTKSELTEQSINDHLEEVEKDVHNDEKEVDAPAAEKIKSSDYDLDKVNEMDNQSDDSKDNPDEDESQHLKVL